jgi:hypothetical protein
MTQINLPCTKKDLIAAYDIKGAFLLTPIEDGVELYLRIGPELTEFWCIRYPERTVYLHNDGCLYFKLESDEGFIRHYKGLSGIKRVYDQLLKELKPKDFYLVISDQQKWISRDPKYFERFKQERAKMDLSIRLILQDSPSARSNKPIQSRYNEQIKILPRKYELASNMVIVPHKVIMVQTVEPIMALVIENKSVVQMNKALFEMLWESVAE